MRPTRGEPAGQRWIWLVPLAALVAASAVMLFEPRALQILRNATFDQFQRWQPRAPADGTVAIVDIDEESLRRLGQWPWPRTRLAELITDLQDLQTASVALDIVLAEPDRTSPRMLLRDEQLPSAMAQDLAALPDHDEALAAVLRRSNVAIGVLATNGPVPVGRSASSAPPAAAKAGVVMIGASPLQHLATFAADVPSLPVLRDAAPGEGALTFVPDADGVIRRVPMFLNLAGVVQPSLSAEALRLAAHATQFMVRTAANDGGLVDVQIGGRRIATTEHGEVWVHYSSRGTMRYVPAWKVLAHEVPVSELGGRIALVGTSAPGLMDLRFGPLGGDPMAGVEVHAQALEQILAGQRLTRPGWAVAVEMLAVIVGGLVVAVVAMRSGAAASGATFAGLSVVLFAGAWLAFSRGDLLLDPLGCSLAWLGVFLPTTVARHMLSEQRQRWVRQAFARYVSPNLVDYLIANPGALELGGERRMCSFVFTDLAGFTALMETIDPTAAVSVLNDYLDQMIKVAFDHDGTLDRIVGDAVAIVFSAPLPQADHQERALRCALAMQRFTRGYVDDLASRGVVFCETRIGVHTGEVTVGNFGGSTIFDYRALGDPVNTASRLESANKQLGTSVCVSAATLAGCAAALARPIGRLQLVGRVEPVMAYQPLDPAARSDALDVERYGAAFSVMAAGNAVDALAAFEALAVDLPDDPLVRLHVRRLRTGAVDDLVKLDGK